MSFIDITRYITTARRAGKTAEDVTAATGVQIKKGGISSYVTSAAEKNRLALYIDGLDVPEVEAAPNAEAATTSDAKSPEVARPARISNARARREGTYDPAGYGDVMGARVTRRDNRVGVTEYDGNTQIWD